MRDKLQKELKIALGMIEANWSMQNNVFDRRTNFLYDCKSLDECIAKINAYDVDKNYVLHRWYNFKTSVEVEYIFCDFGAKHEQDKFNHDVDIYINNIPYDVKLTVYPKALSDRPYDLSTRKGKNQMIRWFYANQSQEGRKQILNRLYVVCDGRSQIEMLEKKCAFDLIERKVEEFMSRIHSDGLNQLEIVDYGKSSVVYADIVVV